MSPAPCGLEVGGVPSAGGSVLAWDEARKHARWWLIRPRHGCREMPWVWVFENFVDQRMRIKNFSAELTIILPRRLRSAATLCYSLIRRLAVYRVIFTESANSSLLTSSAMPSRSFGRLGGASAKSTCANLSRAVSARLSRRVRKTVHAKWTR